MVFPRAADVSWRVAFLVGLIVAAGLYMAFVPGALQPRVDFPRAGLVVAGLLVGFGARMGNGCTSGHGVCGLGRLSGRSLAAVLVFMATAVATRRAPPVELGMSRTTSPHPVRRALRSGLAMSGMTDPRVAWLPRLLRRLRPGSLFVLTGAVLTTVLLFRPVLRRGRSLLGDRLQLSDLTRVDRRLLGGAALFGIGWGAAGYCPGPALAGLGVLSVEALWFVPAMLAGMLLHRLVDRA